MVFKPPRTARFPPSDSWLLQYADRKNMDLNRQAPTANAAPTGEELRTLLETNIGHLAEVNKTFAILQASLQSTIRSLDAVHAQLRTQPVASAPASSLDVEPPTLDRVSNSNEIDNIVPTAQPIAPPSQALLDQSRTLPQGSPTVSTRRKRVKRCRRRARPAAASQHPATQNRDDQQMLQFIAGLEALLKEQNVSETTPTVGRVGSSRPTRSTINRPNRALQELLSGVLPDSQLSSATTRVVQHTDRHDVMAHSFPEQETMYSFHIDLLPTE
ncbi:hypothetical protein B0T10DRAFT_139669 [Thelonectria olida]|uniref:Uncharacterized protein n=1 Tax=Thelonectria olida TaxID=1576542 RepID=A0A9P8VWP3_9HYPO|nr:hypothetical protein B0T10DRAFT_139669 [Thelonectria olida]